MNSIPVLESRVRLEPDGELQGLWCVEQAGETCMGCGEDSGQAVLSRAWKWQPWSGV